MAGKIEDLAARRERKRNDPDRRAASQTSERGSSSTSQAKCPICGRPRDERFRPFCSSRCAEIDLGRWFKESYRVPTRDRPSAEDESED